VHKLHPRSSTVLKSSFGPPPVCIGVFLADLLQLWASESYPVVNKKHTCTLTEPTISLRKASSIIFLKVQKIVIYVVSAQSRPPCW